MTHPRARLVALIAAPALLHTLAGPAWAQSSAPGGLSAPEKPRVSTVACASTAGRTCVRGEMLTIRGTGLRDTRAVVFLGRRGRTDDRRVTPVRSSDTDLGVAVPPTAHSGRVKIIGALDGHAATGPRITVKPGAPAGSTEALNGKVFLDGRPASFAYTIDPGRSDGRVELYDVPTGTIVQSWPAVGDASGAGRVSWNGRIDGQDAPASTYAFRVAGAARAASTSAQPSFQLLDHMFPIRGKHDLGQTATNGFGGGRGHQGQDMFAACGTPLVAARGGTVTEAKYDSRGGNYVVITERSGQSTVYMHMRDPALVERGARVLTGQRIGYVGDSGRAEGCHLHFELWTAPGWYQGGKAIDPLPELRRWDAMS